MARTSNVFAYVEPEIKEQAEQVLEKFGIPIVYSDLANEQFDKEIGKGIADIKSDRVYSADAIEAEMRRDYGI